MIETEILEADNRLMLTATAGDRDAIDNLVSRYRTPLMRHAMRHLRNADDASDAVQETFVKAVRAWGAFDSGRPLHPWLFRICTNCCIDAARNRGRSAASLDRNDYSIPDNGEPADETASRNIVGNRVAEAIARLPENYRTIILMRHFQHKDVNEIAADLNAPEGTVKSWLFRARAMLRKDLSVALN